MTTNLMPLLMQARAIVEMRQTVFIIFGRLAALCLLVVSLTGPVSAATAVQRVTSADGIEAWLVEDHSLPLIAMSITWRGGTVTDPEGKLGLVNLLAGMLNEGGGDLDSEAFQKALEDDAIHLQGSASRDTLSISLQTLSARTDRALELLRLAVTEPRFDADAVERVRNQIVTGLRSRQQRPDRLAGQSWRQLAYGDSPYANDPDGTEASLAAITPDDLHGWAKAGLARDNLIIGVTGDITKPALAAALQRVFGPLPATSTLPKISSPTVNAAAQLVVTPLQQPQSAVMFGQQGYGRDNPDWIAATIVNRVLGGGGFTSRLTQQVREKRGLTYGISTFMVPYRGTGALMGFTQLAGANVAPAVAVIRDVWRDVADNGITQAELDDAKTYLMGNFPLQVATTDDMASYLVSMQLFNLGIDYMDRREELIGGVTLEQANRVAHALLQPDTLLFAIAGPAPGVDSHPAVQN
jgi:zinc protease